MALFEVKKKIPSNLLKDRYLIPPFSILDAKSGYWMTRKQDWEKVLQDRENNIRNIVSRGNTPYINQFTSDDFKGAKSPGAGDISTFDPFLTEILVRWFSLPNSIIYDPFAGGIVRGAVSAILNRTYFGTDISKEQVDHNIICWRQLVSEYSEITHTANWIWSDAEEYHSTVPVDMILTCPPYYNLERYTNDPEDLSNKSSYGDFLDKYKRIIIKCYNMLNEDSFAAIVVEEIRDKQGILYGFVPDTIRAFTEAGFLYYNEMILENRVVSLGIRCPKYFDQSRKVGRHHQNVLIFYKGNPNNVENKFGKFKED